MCLLLVVMVHVLSVLEGEELNNSLLIVSFLGFGFKLESLVVPLSVFLFGDFHVVVGVDNVVIEIWVVVILSWISWLLDGIWVEVPYVVKLFLSNVEAVPCGKDIWSVSTEVWNEIVNWVIFLLSLWVEVLSATS